jgi:DNA-binding NarL/FixJ family response regulator
MVDVGGNDAASAVVLGGSALAREAVTAVLDAAGVRLGPLDEESVAVLVDPSADDWAEMANHASRVVLVTSRQLDADEVLAAVLRGADAVLEADATSARLAHVVRLVSQGGTELSPPLARKVADALRIHVQEEEMALSLTKREREILASIDAGETVKQTARTLGIAPKTVENLQSRLFRKLDVRNRAQAVALAHRLGLISVEHTEPEAAVL